MEITCHFLTSALFWLFEISHYYKQYCKGHLLLDNSLGWYPRRVILMIGSNSINILLTHDIHYELIFLMTSVVLEKTLESPLNCKEIQPVHSKDQSWVFTGRTDAEAETPILWPPHAKSWLIWKDPDAGRDWGQEKGTTEDEMAGWHHQLDRHEFE